MSGPGIADAVVVLGTRSVDAAAYAKLHGYTPTRGMRRLRLPDADEDHVTLAVAALSRLLEGRDINDAGQLLLVGPFDEEDAALIVETFADASIAISFFHGTMSAGADALLMAMNGPADPATIIVGADDAREAPPGSATGSGAVALWLDASGPVRLAHEVHRRTHGGDARAEALQALLAETADDGAAPIALVETFPGEHAGAAGGHAARIVPGHLPQTGGLGAAQPLVTLVEGLTTPQAEAGLVWWVPTEGGAVVARFEGRLAPRMDAAAALAVPAIETEPTVAVRALHAWDDAADALAQGAFVSKQAYLGEAGARYRLEGQRCASCQTVLFPPRLACLQCGGSHLAPFLLSGKGTVFARTRIAAGGGPTEFDPLQQAVGDYGVAIVALAEGPRVAAMVAGGAGDITIGAPVRLLLRLLYVQEGMRRYGFKAVLDGAAPE